MTLVIKRASSMGVEDPAFPQRGGLQRTQRALSGETMKDAVALPRNAYPRSIAFVKRILPRLGECEK
jgi:hypothetical protein